jgi:hypothetical protein
MSSLGWRHTRSITSKYVTHTIRYQLQAMAASGFLCICPQKTVEFGDKNKLRDAKALQLAKELGFDSADVNSSEGILLCGGGIRVFNATERLGTATLESCAVVFQGCARSAHQRSNVPGSTQHHLCNLHMKCSMLHTALRVIRSPCF